MYCINPLIVFFLDLYGTETVWTRRRSLYLPCFWHTETLFGVERLQGHGRKQPILLDNRKGPKSRILRVSYLVHRFVSFLIVGCRIRDTQTKNYLSRNVAAVRLCLCLIVLSPHGSIFTFSFWFRALLKRKGRLMLLRIGPSRFEIRMSPTRRFV